MRQTTILQNKPLVEAIFELRWELETAQSEMKRDPHYKILVGGLYDRLREEYPFHEDLPASNLPDIATPHHVHHRFRKADGEWPVVQVGPGIVTVNDTENYVWDDFHGRIQQLVKTLMDTYPNAESNLRINSLLLRYIDSIQFDYNDKNVLSLLAQKLKVNIDIGTSVFEEGNIHTSPTDLNVRFSFPCSRPKGTLGLKFARGKTKGSDSLIWETMLHSTGRDAPSVIDLAGISNWADRAHNRTHDCFFSMIAGELFERFR